MKKLHMILRQAWLILAGGHLYHRYSDDMVDSHLTRTSMKLQPVRLIDNRLSHYRNKRKKDHYK